MDALSYQSINQIFIKEGNDITVLTDKLAALNYISQNK